MKIVVKCSCGKILRLSVEYAGKHAKCPQCNKLNVVPTLANEESVAQIEVRSCPTCGLYLSTEDEECTSCCTNLKTGEWKARNKTIPKNKISIIYFLTHALLVVIILILSMQVYTKKNPIDMFLLQQKRLPEESIPELENKLFTLQKFYKNSPIKTFIGYQKNILCKIREKTKKQLSPMQIFFLSEKNSNQKIITAKLVSYLHAYETKINQLIEEHRHEEIVSRITPKLLEEFSFILSNYTNNITFKKSMNLIINTYKKNTKNNKEAQKIKWLQCKKNFQDYLKDFYNAMYQREYKKVQVKLEKFWNDINSLEYTEIDNKLTREIRQKLNHVQSINNLIYTAKKSATYSKGLKRNFYLRNGKKVTGRVQKYTNGIFYLKNENGQEYSFLLVHLSARDIIFLALRTNKQYHTYLHSAIFLTYEKAYENAQKLLQIAKNQGASSQEILLYHQWLKTLTNQNQRK